MNHLCKRLVDALDYLEPRGLTQDQLSSIHHFSLKGKGVSYSTVRNYFNEEKNLGKRNTDFANRVIAIAEGYKNNKENFSQLIVASLSSYPLE